MNFLHFFIFIFIFTFPLVGETKLLQILHTNDLHSMLVGSKTNKGGYAKLKTVIDQLKQEALAQNIPTLYLDAGDFGEGSSFYFSDQGVDSLRALDLLGVDITVLGNHDYMLGGKELKNQLLESKFKAKILSANLGGKRFLGLKNLVPSHVDYQLDDLKIRIFGLSTSEIHYQYPLRPLGWIKSSVNTGIKMEKQAQKDGADFVIALTHLGLFKDIELVEKSNNIDLVVGGHSHTLITYPEMVKNSYGKEIPILQAGAHSLYVGSLIIDIHPNKNSKIIKYQMHPIHQAITENDALKNFVESAKEKRDQYFNRNWDEIIGYSTIPLSGTIEGLKTNYQTCWSRHIARMTRNVAKADLGFQFDEFQGEEISSGDIKFGDIIDNFPHFRKWNDQGWKIKKAWIQGFILKKILSNIANSSYGTTITIDGLNVLDKDSNQLRPFNLIKDSVYEAYIEDMPLRNTKYYSVALPSEIPYAMIKTFNVLGYIIFNNLRTIPNSYYWELIEDYIRKNSPMSCELKED